MWWGTAVNLDADDARMSCQPTPDVGCPCRDSTPINPATRTGPGCIGHHRTPAPTPSEGAGRRPRGRDRRPGAVRRRSLSRHAPSSLSLLLLRRHSPHGVKNPLDRLSSQQGTTFIGASKRRPGKLVLPRRLQPLRRDDGAAPRPETSSWGARRRPPRLVGGHPERRLNAVTFLARPRRSAARSRSKCSSASGTAGAAAESPRPPTAHRSQTTHTNRPRHDHPGPPAETKKARRPACAGRPFSPSRSPAFAGSPTRDQHLA